MTDNILALLDLAIRLATAVAWIGITILAGAATAVAGCLAWAVWRITRGVRRRAVRRGARRRIRARRRAALIAGEGWAVADAAAINAEHYAWAAQIQADIRALPETSCSHITEGDHS
jgi:hypothetical protein